MLVKASRTDVLQLAKPMIDIALRAPAPVIARVRPGRPLIVLAILLAFLAIEASRTPVLAAKCAPASEIAASRTRWAAVRKQFDNATDHDLKCRVFAASFYESVMTRQMAVACARDANRDPDISALDSEIDAFNNLLAAKCGS